MQNIKYLGHTLDKFGEYCFNFVVNGNKQSVRYSKGEVQDIMPIGKDDKTCANVIDKTIKRDPATWLADFGQEKSVALMKELGKLQSRKSSGLLLHSKKCYSINFWRQDYVNFSRILKR